MKRVISLIIGFILPIYSYAGNEEVLVKKNEILVHYHNIKQVIYYDVEPDYLDYNFKFIDFNKDNKIDLVLIEKNEPNNTSIVFKGEIGSFNKNPELYNDIRIGENYNCSFSQDSITVFYPHKTNRVSNDEKRYNIIVNKCIKLTSIYNN